MALIAKTYDICTIYKLVKSILPEGICTKVENNRILRRRVDIGDEDPVDVQEVVICHQELQIVPENMK